MATSLAQQLAGIRANAAVQNINFQKRKKLPSLLFSPSEAADQDIDQVFAIAANGFEELASIQPALRSFERTLFAEDAKLIDRATQTRAQNDKLEAKIRSFLDQAAPYFLLRPTQKCLEWLVRRFDVCFTLPEYLILTFMPFHSTPTFAKLLSILELPPQWAFLGASKKLMEPPALSLLVKACCATPTMLTLLIEHVWARVQTNREHSRQVGFYADVCVRAISHQRDGNIAEEDIVSRFLPVAGEALGLKEHPEFQIANYMVIAVLSTRASLSSDVVVAVMQKVVAGVSEQSKRSALICLAQLVQQHEGFHALAEGVASQLSTQDLLDMCKQFSADKLMTSFALSLCMSRTPASVEEVGRLLSSGFMTRAETVFVLQAVAKQVLESAELTDYRASVSKLLEDARLLNLFATAVGDKLADVELALQMTLTQPEPISIDVTPVPQIEEAFSLPVLGNEETWLSLLDARKLLNDLIAPGQLAKTLAQVDDKMSFLARVSLSANEVKLQVEALQQLASLMSSSKDDMQGLLPILICLLSSKSEQVRTATFAVIELIKPPKTKRIWGIDDLYGPHSADLKWLSASEVQHFLQVLLAEKHACLLDHKVIYKTVGQAMQTHGHKGKDLAHRTTTLHWLASHILHAPLAKIVLKLLLCFDKTPEPTSAKTRAVSQRLQEVVDDATPLAAQCRLELIDPAVIHRLLIRQVVASEAGSLQLLLKLVHDQNDVFGPPAIIWLASLYPSMKREYKADYVRSLVNGIVDGPSQVSRQANVTIEQVDLTTDLLAELINEVDIEPLTAQAKRLKTTAVDPDIALRRFTSLLEVVERHEPQQYALLLPLLFSKLNDLVVAEAESDVSVSFTEQLLLSCMLPMVSKENAKDCRVDILISCIRGSSSPQVHNRALLLVAALAEAAPEQVLHGVMPIFTFMGANLLRQDDGFSAHVIETTIQHVVPPLLASLGSKAEDRILGASGILQSFVDAFPHVPKHRRPKLFVTLVQTLGEEQFLAPLLAVFAQKRAEIPARQKPAPGVESAAAYLDFCLLLLRQFPPLVQLKSLQGLSEICRQVPDEAPVAPEPSLLVHVNVDLDKLRNSLVKVIAAHLSSKKVRSELEVAPQEPFARLVESLLMLCDEVEAEVADTALDALDRAITLLPAPLFVSVVQDLLLKSEPMQVKALEMIAARGSADMPSLVGKVAGLVSDGPLLCSALETLSTLGRRFGKQEPSIFLPVAEAVVSLETTDMLAKIQAVDTTTTLAVVLGPRILPFLPRFMPQVLEQLTSTSKEEDADLLPLATCSLLESLVRTIPSFMASYTAPIMQRATDFHLTTDELTSEKKSLLSTLATTMPTRNVLGAISTAWTAYGKAANKKSFVALIAVLQETIDQSTRQFVTGSSKEILSLFLQALDIRGQSKSWDVKGIEQVEKKTIAALLNVVLKLNDTTFRPLFLKLKSWAFTGTDQPAALLARQITFFNFMVQFTSTFKGIILNYYNYLLEDMIELLQSQPNRKLWVGVVSSLTLAFQHDTQEHWKNVLAGDKAEQLINLLVSQLDAASTYPSQITVPAIVELTSALQGSEQFTKHLNTRVLARFGHEDAQVRLSAVSCENQLCAKLGEEWLAHVPQLIPCIAEALEDEDERVERMASSLAVTIEGFLGESLDKYLKV